MDMVHKKYILSFIAVPTVPRPYFFN